MEDAGLSEHLELLKGVSTATVTMQLLKRGLRSCAMVGPRRFAGPPERLVGPAYTLRCVPMREDVSTTAFLGSPDNAQKIAIEECPAGHILVIGGGGETRCGLLGDILAARLKVRGVAGAVADTGMRDAPGIRAVGLPVFCQGAAAPANITWLTPADKQVRIGCGGVLVDPGDVIVADDDGAVVIPQGLVAEVAVDGAEQERFELFVQEKVLEGQPTTGLYPPNEKAKEAYRQWLQAGNGTDG